MKLGCAYYPEHRDPALWKQDAEWMADAGFTVVRMGEFAWCRMEPREDRFDFDWIEQAVGILAERGIQTIIGTPTAGPPAWLVAFGRPEDDSRQVYEDGGAWELGGRNMLCVNHPRYLERSLKIAAAVAARFKDAPSVLAFQIDNEPGMYGMRCLCPRCAAGFRGWMREKYGTIAEVNRRLGMVFGGSEFGSFDDIPIPRRRQDLHNPGLLMDSQRFFAESQRRFVHRQAQAIRDQGARQPITTNLCHMLSGGDGHDGMAMFEALDVAGWDCYPVQFAADPKPQAMGLLHAIARAYKHGTPYWMLEQQSGSPMAAAADDPSRIALWTWQSIAHGAELILFFRWDTCRFGGEQYWRGILDHENVKNERFQAIAQASKQIRSAAKDITGLRRDNRIAFLLDNDACQSHFMNPLGPAFSYRAHAEAYAGAVNRLGWGYDAIFEPPQPGSYAVVIAPALRLMDERWASLLRAYVAQGGTLLVTIATATLDRDHVAPSEPVPWKLTDVFGVRREEWSALGRVQRPPKERMGESRDAWENLGAPDAIPVMGEGPLSGSYAAQTWCDHLDVAGADVLARYAEGTPAAGRAAVTSHRFGKGRAVYCASVFEDRLLDALLGHLAGRNAAAPSSASPWVEVVPCRASKGTVCFVLNHGAEEATVTTPGPGRELLSGIEFGPTLEIAGYEAMILSYEVR
jgi:beta-galactosidase